MTPTTRDTAIYLLSIFKTVLDEKKNRHREGGGTPELHKVLVRMVRRHCWGNRQTEPLAIENLFQRLDALVEIWDAAFDAGLVGRRFNRKVRSAILDLSGMSEKELAECFLDE